MNIAARTGEDFEKVVFGFSRQEVQRKKISWPKGLDFRARVAELRKAQHLLGWDPKNPATKAAKALYDRVRSKMGPEKDLVLLIFAIGTEFDFQFGTDMIFLCNKRVVTVDLTISPRGKLNAKANVVLTLADFQANRHYQVGDVIAKLLQEAA